MRNDGKWNRAWLLLSCCIVLSGCGTIPSVPREYAPGELPRVLHESTAASPYIQRVQTEPDTYIMQTGRRTFRSARADEPTIELLGAVHVADAAYYQAVQKRLDEANLVLFEGVGAEAPPPEDEKPDSNKSGKSKSANPSYESLASALRLVEQDAGIDYKRQHFVGCDMSLQQMREILEKEKAAGGKSGAEAAAALRNFEQLTKVLDGNSFMVSMAFWMLKHSDYLQAYMRLAMVGEADPDETEAAQAGLHPRLMALIVDDRNAHILTEMDRILKMQPLAGARVIMFYGCDHLPGLEKGLLARGYQPTGPIEMEDAITVHPFAEGLDRYEVEKVVPRPAPAN